MIRRLFRDWLDGLRAGFDVVWWGHAYPRTLPLRRGGSMPAYRPAADEQRAILSPGRVSPHVHRYLSDEDIQRINQGRPDDR